MGHAKTIIISGLAAPWVIHKPRGLVFGILTPFVEIFAKLILCSNVVIWMTPFPSNVHVVYGYPNKPCYMQRRSFSHANFGEMCKIAFQRSQVEYHSLLLLAATTDLILARAADQEK